MTGVGTRQPVGVAAGWPEHLFASSGAPSSVRMETENGETIVIRCGPWHRTATRADLAILGRSRGPVLDVGCGPGRLVAALAARGCDVLGIDTSRSAVAATRDRGGAVEQVSVFGAVPRAGEWGTALLMDGNVGIGGDVATLLGRLAEVLQPNGLVLVETASPYGRSGQALVRIHHGSAVGDWFPWAWVTPPELATLAQFQGFVTDECWHIGGRWFAQLRRRPSDPQ